MGEFGGFDPPSGPPAGWYPDPYDPRAQRYWDGRQWDLSSPVHGARSLSGSGDYPDVGEWLDRGFRSAYRRWRAAAIVALLTAPVTTVAGYYALDRFASGVVITEDSIEGWTNDRIGPAVALSLVAILASAIGGLALTWLMLRSVDDDTPERPTLSTELVAAGRALLAAITALPRAVGWFLLLAGAVAAATLTVVVLAVLAGPLALLALLAILPFGVWLAVKWAFVALAIMDRRGNPFPRSSATSTGRWWSTLGRLLLLGIVMWLISLVIQLLGTLVAGGGFSAFGGGLTIEVDSNGHFDPIVLDDAIQFSAWTLTVAAIVSSLGAVAASSVSAAAMALLYRTRNPAADDRSVS
jgi:hypothetical protein